jgi:hypothetical protein
MTDEPQRGERRRRRVARKDDVFPTFDEIAARAYELFVAEGKRVERVFDCWQRAETELLERAARRAIR